MSRAAAVGAVSRAAVSIGALYRSHHHWLLAWLKRRLRCPDDAADLAHDVYARVLALPALPSLREPRAYLLVIANRLLIDRHRRRRLEDETLRAVAASLATSEPGADERVAMQELLRQVVLLLAEEIGDKPRQALLMARIEGCSYAQIARRLGVSESRVKQYLSQVLVHCHARLFGEDP